MANSNRVTSQLGLLVPISFLIIPITLLFTVIYQPLGRVMMILILPVIGLAFLITGIWGLWKGQFYIVGIYSGAVHGTLARVAGLFYTVVGLFLIAFSLWAFAT